MLPASAPFKPRNFYTLILLAAFLWLAPLAADRFTAITSHLREDIPYLLNTSLEERRLDTYGDQDIMGWGYVKKILEDIPDSRVYPLVRYPYYGMNVELVLPGNRTELDKRILVGIDLRPPDLMDSKVAAAHPVMVQKNPDSLNTAWVFATTWDYDVLNAIEVKMKKPASAKTISFRATLLHSHENRRPIGRWEWPSQPPQPHYKLAWDPPVREIYGRGSLPFVLLLEARPEEGNVQSLHIEEVFIRGTKVDLEGYTLVHQEGFCFTAFDNEFLKEIFQDPQSPWASYIRHLRNIES